MVAMAVIASGDIGGDVGFAQSHRFAMISVAVMLQPVLVTAPAALVTGHLEMAVLGPLDLMGRMAVGANRPAFIPFSQQLAMNALVIGLLDFDVALATSLSHVGSMNRGIPVHRAFDVVDTMAIIARRSHDEPHLQQRPPMNAVHVLGGGLRMLHLVFAGQTGIAMTGSTSLGQVQFKDRRIGVLDGQNVVVAVAIHATCGARGAESVADAVNAGGVLPSRLFMASAAIDRLGRDVIV